MKAIDCEYLLEGKKYYILFNGTKYIGDFSNIFHYNYYSIAVFDNVCYMNSNSMPNITKYFIINDYYFNYTYFYIPELENLLLKQVLRQKIEDKYLLSNIIQHYSQS